MKTLFVIAMVVLLGNSSCKRDVFSVNEILSGKNWYAYRIHSSQYLNSHFVSDTTYFTNDCQKENSYFLSPDGRAIGELKCSIGSLNAMPGSWIYNDTTKMIVAYIPVIMDRGSGTQTVFFGIPKSNLVSYSAAEFIAKHTEVSYGSGSNGLADTLTSTFITTYRVR